MAALRTMQPPPHRRETGGVKEGQAVKCYEITFYYPQPKRRRVNWEAVLWCTLMLCSAALWTKLLLG
jgi:hypothetical protein